MEVTLAVCSFLLLRKTEKSMDNKVIIYGLTITVDQYETKRTIAFADKGVVSRLLLTSLSVACLALKTVHTWKIPLCIEFTEIQKLHVYDVNCSTK